MSTFTIRGVEYVRDQRLLGLLATVNALGVPRVGLSSATPGTWGVPERIVGSIDADGYRPNGRTVG